MKKVLFPILALVLALGLNLPMATPVLASVTALTITSPTTASPVSVSPGETVDITYQVTVDTLDEVVDRQVSILTSPETTVNPPVISQPLSATSFSVTTTVTVPLGAAPGTYDVRVRARQPATGSWTTEINTEAVIVASGPAITVEKDYRYTNVCFEKDNDGDGEFNEDPINFEIDGITPIDDDEDGLFNEDPVDCDETYLGDFLPMDDDYYLLEAVVNKRDVVKSYNPGQYYAVSTVNVLTDVDMLTIEEDFSDCMADEVGISVLNPVKGGGKVVIVQIGGEINGEPVPDTEAAYQILDAKSPEESVSIEGDVATVILGPQEAGTTILMYVKFGPALKGEEWEGPYEPCENTTSAWVVADPGDDDIESDNAMLELLLKE